MEIATQEKKNTIERKDFMKQVGIGFGAIVLMNCLQACTGENIPDPNPGGNGTKVDFTLNLNESANNTLNKKGGFLVPSGKGVIVARTLDDAFIAVSSTCTHEGTTINKYDAANHKFICPNHLSEFDDTGKVLKSPATAALKKYSTAFDETANTLRIFE